MITGDHRGGPVTQSTDRSVERRSRRMCRGLHKTANTVLGDLAKVKGIPKHVVDGWPSTAIRIWGTRKDLRRRLAAAQSLLEMGLVHI